ncbi:hypothetical protein COD92_21965 [Bacillus sp. AFS037270]|nr:hypothetical protein COD92_21965 [Bacillus sp. AFS037270]
MLLPIRNCPTPCKIFRVKVDVTTFQTRIVGSFQVRTYVLITSCEPVLLVVFALGDPMLHVQGFIQLGGLFLKKGTSLSSNIRNYRLFSKSMYESL